MKINKKIKSSLISTLTLIASAISVVACGNNPKPKDNNYKNFVAKITDLKMDNFASEFSSFSKIDPKFKTESVHSFNLNDQKIKEENLNFYNVSNLASSKEINEISHKLTDLKDGGIKYDGKGNIVFVLDNKEVSLENILFSENFDLTINVNDEKKTDSHEITFSNVTALFKIGTVNDKKDFSIKFNNWKDKLIPIHSSYDFGENKIAVNVDEKNKNIFSKTDAQLGLSKDAKNYIFWGDYSKSEKITWKLSDDKGNGILPDLVSSYLFNNQENSKITIQKGDLTINCSSVGAFFDLKGNSEGDKPENLTTRIMGMFDKDHPLLDKNSNFYAEFEIGA